MLFRKLADENADVDPDDEPARAVRRQGADRARRLHAARRARRSTWRPIPSARLRATCTTPRIFFGDKDAQFELAKLYLSGDGASDDVRRGLHYLSTLTEESYPGAQAVARRAVVARRATSRRTSGARWRSSPWRSRTRRRTSASGSRTSTRASSARTSQGTRKEADGIVARWRKMFARPAAAPTDRMGLGARELQPERKCANGETVAIRRAAVPVAGAGGATGCRPAPPPRSCRAAPVARLPRHARDEVA